MLCRGCSQNRPLIKAHITPYSFFRILKTDESALRLHTNIKGLRTKKAPQGVYDTNILCAECENTFQQYDDYGFKLLSQPLENYTSIFHDNELVGYRLNNVNLNLLKIFFMSILWRSSISTQQFYSKVSLGKLEHALKNLIWSGKEGEPHDFSFFLARFDDNSSVMLDPHPQRWSGIRYYRFYLGDHILNIKADTQKTPKQWEKLISNSDKLSILSHGKLDQSKEYNVLTKILARSR